MPLPGFISDDQMAQLDAGGSLPDFISDDDMAKLDARPDTRSGARRAWDTFKDVIGAPAAAADWLSEKLPGVKKGPGATGDLLRKANYLTPFGWNHLLLEKGWGELALKLPEPVRPYAAAA